MLSRSSPTALMPLFQLIGMRYVSHDNFTPISAESRAPSTAENQGLTGSDSDASEPFAPMQLSIAQ